MHWRCRLNSPFITELGILDKVALFWPEPELMTSRAFDQGLLEANVKASRPIKIGKDMMLLQTLAI